MVKLFSNQPKRFFAFGCSFTNYDWATWANILAYELNVPFYNFGKIGVGNYYISQAIAQADAVYDFNKNDLVIVCWTNISREDRWTDETGWITKGNIYSQSNTYPPEFVRKYANHTHFALRDFAMIKLVDELLLNKTQHHHLQMLNVAHKINKWENLDAETNNQVDKLKTIYKTTLDKLLPDYNDVVTNFGDIDQKIQKDRREIDKKFCDGHPTIAEHYEYLTKTFDHKFKPTTSETVQSTHEQFVKFIRNSYKDVKKPSSLDIFGDAWLQEFTEKFILCRPLNHSNTGATIA